MQKSLLMTVAVSIVMVSCLCWGKIISENYSRDEVAVEQEITKETTTVEQIKDNAILFSGAMLVLARHLSLNNDKD